MTNELRELISAWALGTHFLLMFCSPVLLHFKIYCFIIIIVTYFYYNCSVGDHTHDLVQRLCYWTDSSIPVLWFYREFTIISNHLKMFVHGLFQYMWWLWKIRSLPIESILSHFLCLHTDGKLSVLPNFLIIPQVSFNQISKNLICTNIVVNIPVHH